jgi:hypothetical protein
MSQGPPPSEARGPEGDVGAQPRAVVVHVGGNLLTVPGGDQGTHLRRRIGRVPDPETGHRGLREFQEPFVGAGLHEDPRTSDLLGRIPFLETNIVRSQAQHEQIVAAILAGDVEAGHVTPWSGHSQPMPSPSRSRWRA